MSARVIKFSLSLALLAGLVFAAQHFRLYRWFGPRLWPYSRQVPLNLLEAMNNDGFAWEANAADGFFHSPADNLGYSFPAEPLPESGAVFTCKSLPSVRFLFPNKMDGAFNNISCSGQKLDVPPASYDKLYVLGAAENGRREESLLLSYEDKTEVSAPLKFSDWCEPPGFGELTAFSLAFRVAWDARTKKSVRENTRTHLWIQEVSVDPARCLKRITLPSSPNLHIFSMTLLTHHFQYHCALYAEETARAYASILTEEQALFLALQAQAASIRAALHSLGTGEDARFLRESRWVELQLQHIQRRLPTPPLRAVRTRLRGIQVEFDELRKLLDPLLEGRNPFTARRGVVLKGFLSETDGTLQPYSLNVPSDYDGSKAYPLVVSLHGHGWYAPFQGHPAPAIPAAIVLSPHGRGSIDYFFIAESDVLSAIHDVQRDYNIDPNRVYLLGHSMGGTGSWSLGVRFPDVFAAIAPNAGNADHKVWRREWQWRGEPDPPPDIAKFFSALGNAFFPNPNSDRQLEVRDLGDLERYIADSADPATYAENLCNLPAYCIHGATDEIVPVGHARSMTSRLKALKYPVRYVELPTIGHGGFPSEEIKKQREWLLQQVRNPKPASVRFRTNKLRYPGAYWLYIDSFQTPVPFAHIEARASGSLLDVSTRNVHALSIDLLRCPLVGKKGQVKVDGKVAYEGDIGPGASSPASSPPPGVGAGTRLRLALDANGLWKTATPPSGRLKRAGLEGPVEDAFMSPFLLVYGTTSNTAFARWIVKSEADRLAADWFRMYTQPPRMKADVEVSEEDLANYNLILYGGPNDNVLTAQVMPKLPIRLEGSRVRFGKETLSGDNLGVKFCYPNPLNEQRYVVVFAGTTWRALFQINNRFGNWFNWGVYDNRNWSDFFVFDDRSVSTDTSVAVGFFDRNWNLDERFVWRGDSKKRSAVLPRAVPEALAPPPNASTLHLSDLLPAAIDQHKGPVNMDRSFEGRAIRIGGQTFERGLGIRAPSVVEFDLEGRFDSLRLVAGIDLEDRDVGTPARTKFEAVVFSVFGDGKQLFRSESLKWFSKPAVADVNVSGVKRLRLVADASGARWHLGSAAWGDLKLTRTAQQKK